MQIRRSTLNQMTRLLGAFAITIAAGCGQATASPVQAPEPERVNIGYGTQAEDEVTGSVASVTAEEIENMRVSRVEELLEGRVAGLQVIRRGGDFSLRIRGTSSLMGSTEPLVVIDGMPVQRFGLSSALAGLSPHDIERIDILKDAGSAAIYGSRGANGVVLISTKRAR